MRKAPAAQVCLLRSYVVLFLPLGPTSQTAFFQNRVSSCALTPWKQKAPPVHVCCGEMLTQAGMLRALFVGNYDPHPVRALI